MISKISNANFLSLTSNEFQIGFLFLSQNSAQSMIYNNHLYKNFSFIDVEACAQVFFMQLKYKRVRSRSTIGIIGNKKHHQSSMPWNNINPENYFGKLSSMLKLFRLRSLKIRSKFDFNMVVESKSTNLLILSKSKLSLNLNHILLINMISCKKGIFLCKTILYGLFNLEL